MPRGQCTLPPDEAGRMLDRLAGLEQVIPPRPFAKPLRPQAAPINDVANSPTKSSAGLSWPWDC